MTPNEIIDLIARRQWCEARRLVREAALAGRAYLEAADASNGGAARVLIDGVPVGQASTLIFWNHRTDTGRHSGVIIPTYDYRYTEGT